MKRGNVLPLFPTNQIPYILQDMHLLASFPCILVERLQVIYSVRHLPDTRLHLPDTIISLHFAHLWYFVLVLFVRLREVKKMTAADLAKRLDEGQEWSGDAASVVCGQNRGFRLVSPVEPKLGQGTPSRLC